MRLARLAAGGLAPVLTAGCAYTAAAPSAQQQVVDELRGAYQHITALPAVTAAVTETVQSGTVAVTQGKGTLTWEFPRRTGETSLTVAGDTTVVAVRAGDTFFEGRNHKTLAGSGRDLTDDGRTAPQSMPQIQAPGLDPFQLMVLLDGTRWPDAVVTSQPVVTSDDSGQHIEYQLGVDTARLAAHQRPADRAWLREMSRQPGGKVVSLVATLKQGRVATLTAVLPVAKPSSTPTTKLTGPAPAVKPVTVVVAAVFSYEKRPTRIAVPS
ncbi:hypothetical protein [Streptomyces sp. DSM 15324]|uniref:hypothetical protein n=1 Tax=Streptomyces sp. DSM 15324 TaxID=1739111 RepID=UPI000747B8B0|nr:hypothetical protein [Streptomyces sp. DSM 15324]KUO11012.1 hypothetical protein AQJ58_15800 [Streptomyces sp. DSM 15324]